MKVYVVTYEIPYEGSTLKGVFSSREKAKVAVDGAVNILPQSYRAEEKICYVISEVELDLADF